MKLRVYQLNKDRAGSAPVWIDKGRDKPVTNAALYDEVFRGEGNWKDISEAVRQFQEQGHLLFRGRSIQPTDVFVTEQGCFFLGWEGVIEVAFDPSQTQKPGHLLRCVYVEPNYPAYEADIGENLMSMQKAVGGLIECVSPHGDKTILVCNDEGKLLGMEGNRRLNNGSVIAGPFFVIGDAGENFRSLTDAEVNRYLQMYAEPQQISQREVQADMGMTFYCF